MKLSILIPAYNEEKTIKRLVTIVKNVDLESKGIEKEIIVIDDGSRDRTKEIVNKIKGIALIQHSRNQGKGAAIRTGIERATGDITIVQDADLEYDPNDYYKLITPIINGQAKVVYGSRVLHHLQKMRNRKFLSGKNKQAYYAFYLGGRILTLLTNILYFSRITDEPTGYKAIDTKLLKSLNLKCKRFEFCPEVTAKLLKRGYTIIELPTPYYPRSFKEGKKIKVRDGIEAIWTLIKYRFID